MTAKARIEWNQKRKTHEGVEAAAGDREQPLFSVEVYRYCAEVRTFSVEVVHW